VVGALEQLNGEKSTFTITEISTYICDLPALHYSHEIDNRGITCGKAAKRLALASTITNQPKIEISS
jgi:hypothetical protein